MKIFMDTANVDEIREFADMGIVYGVTTNPSLIAKSGRSQADVIPEICSLIPGPVSAEVISLDCAGMLEEAHKLVKIAENVVIKIPCTAEGLKAVKVLSSEGIRVNVTLIFSLPQALLAARAGAELTFHPLLDGLMISVKTACSWLPILWTSSVILISRRKSLRQASARSGT